METINVEKQTKYQFELDRLNLKSKDNRQISQDEFVSILIKHWRLK